MQTLEVEIGSVAFTKGFGTLCFVSRSVSTKKPPSIWDWRLSADIVLWIEGESTSGRATGGRGRGLDALPGASKKGSDSMFVLTLETWDTQKAKARGQKSNRMMA